MADEHSFDIVSRVDMQEVSNAVQQAVKEISSASTLREQEQYRTEQGKGGNHARGR